MGNEVPVADRVAVTRVSIGTEEVAV